MNHRLLPLFLTALTLTGCVTTTPPVLTALETQQGTTLSRDEYKKLNHYGAPAITCNEPLMDNCTMSFFKSQGDTGTPLYYLRVVYSASSWAFFDSAYDINGKKLRFHPVSQKVGGFYGITEQFSLLFTLAELRKAQKTGMDISVRGQKSQQITVPGFYIEGFLAAVAK